MKTFSVTINENGDWTNPKCHKKFCIIKTDNDGVIVCRYAIKSPRPREITCNFENSMEFIKDQD